VKSPPATTIKLFRLIVLLIKVFMSLSFISSIDSKLPELGFAKAVPLKRFSFNKFFAV